MNIDTEIDKAGDILDDLNAISRDIDELSMRLDAAIENSQDLLNRLELFKEHINDLYQAYRHDDTYQISFSVLQLAKLAGLVKLGE